MQTPWFPLAPHTLDEAGLDPGRVEQLVLKSLYDLNGATGSSLAQQWDHRPDIEFSPPGEVCDDDVAARYLDHVPE